MTTDRPDDATLALRVLPMPRDTNGYGTIFGGVILSFIDQAGLVEAVRHGRHRWVTASIERVDFLAPVFVGDFVDLWTRTVRTGRTSVTVETIVEARRGRTPPPPPDAPAGTPAPMTVLVTRATTTMVAVDAHGRPIPFRDPPTV